MNFDWRNIDLKNASIFDLTDDIELIRVCINDSFFSIDDKDEYIKNSTPMKRCEDFIEYCEATENSEGLYDEICKVFRYEIKEMETMFNE